jgi:glycosyltransferase involved in cell wall biosynthesis
VLEALASGTPAVASQIAPFTEHLSDDDVTWADPLDAGSIASALEAALAKPVFAPPAVCRRFDWANSAERHAAIYRGLIRADIGPPNHLPVTEEPFAC